MPCVIASLNPSLFEPLKVLLVKRAACELEPWEERKRKLSSSIESASTFVRSMQTETTKLRQQQQTLQEGVHKGPPQKRSRRSF
jgi:hypothetical protein